MKLTKQRIGDYIKDVASGPFGSNLKVECFVPTGFPIIDGANLTGLRVSDNITKFVTEEKARSLSRSIAKRRDVIVTISGTLGQVSYIPDDSKYEEYLCSQRQFRVTFDESKINVEYIVNLLRTPYGQRKILAFANYVGVPALAQPIPNFKNIELYLPDLPTQLRIAGVLGSLDEKVALNRKKIAELEALAKTIYDYWFVQFDFPDKDGKPYKSSGGKMVWSEQLKREVPEGWAVELLPQIADYLFGNPFDSSLFTSSGKGFPIVRIRNVKDGFTSDRTTESASKEYIIHNGDFLIGMDGYFDMNHWIGGDAYLVQRSCRVNAKDDLYAAWLSMSLVSPIKHLEKSLTGATLAHLGKAHLDKIVLPKPPTSMSNALSFLNNLLEQKVHLGIANLELVRQRDELLPLLMNGQVVVK